MKLKIKRLTFCVRNFKVYHRWVSTKTITKDAIYQVEEDDDIYVLAYKKRVDNFGAICDLIYKSECAYHQQWLRDNKITEILLK